MVISGNQSKDVGDECGVQDMGMTGRGQLLGKQDKTVSGLDE